MTVDTCLVMLFLYLYKKKGKAKCYEYIKNGEKIGKHID